MELNFILIIGFLNNSNFITKSNKIKLYALSGTCNSYNFYMVSVLSSLSFNIYISVGTPLLAFLYVKSSSVS